MDKHTDSYWYARGYYDGRHDGWAQVPEGITGPQEHSYRIGYDAGVTDYCDIDEPALSQN